MTLPPDVVGQMAGTEGMEEYLHAELEKHRLDPLTYGHTCHSMQEEVQFSRARRRIVVAGNRTGKTEGAMKDVLWTARGAHPYRKVRRASVLWVGSPDYPSYLRFHRPAFDEWCPPGWIIGKFHESEKYVDIRRYDGGKCRIFFLSYDMPRSKWQGAGVDGIWLDEECPEDILGECLARIVTTQGWIMLTFTPVSGVGWWFDRIFKPAQEGLNGWDAFQFPLATYDEENDADFNVGDTLVPHLTRDQIVEFASEYPDPDERAIRIFGEVRGRQGLVYKQYRHEVHRIPDFLIPPDYEIWGGLDPGYHGFAATIGAIDPSNRVYVCEEYFSQTESTKTRFQALAKRVRGVRDDKDWEQIVRPTVVFFVDTEDPQLVLELNIQAAEAYEEDVLQSKDGEPVIQLVFASLDQGLKARKAGFLRVQQILSPKKDRPTPKMVARETPKVGEPMMYFMEGLYSEWQAADGFHRGSRVVWEIEHYSWKPPAKGTTTLKDDANEDSANGAHALAGLRYMTMARLGPPEEMKPEADKNRDQNSAEVWAQLRKMEDDQLEREGY